MRKINKFLTLNKAQKYLFIKAFYYLAWMRLMILLFPLRWIAKVFNFSEGMRVHESYSEISKIQEIRTSIQRAAANVPWECTCLVRSLAESILLRKYGISSTLYLGVAKDKVIGEKYSFHAWIGLPAIEEKKCEDYKIISSFTTLV